MSVVFENNRHFFCFFIVFALILLLNCLFTVRGLRRGYAGVAHCLYQRLDFRNFDKNVFLFINLNF